MFIMRDELSITCMKRNHIKRKLWALRILYSRKKHRSRPRKKVLHFYFTSQTTTAIPMVIQMTAYYFRVLHISISGGCKWLQVGGWNRAQKLTLLSLAFVSLTNKETKE